MNRRKENGYTILMKEQFCKGSPFIFSIGICVEKFGNLFSNNMYSSKLYRYVESLNSELIRVAVVAQVSDLAS